MNAVVSPSHYDYDSFSPAWQPPDGYELLHKLGRGRYSEVFLGLQTSTQQAVVLKVLKPVKKRKIKREIHVLQRLQGGPHIIRLLDCVRDPVTRYCSLVFEHVEAVDFKQAFGLLSEGEVRLLMRRLLEALDWSHSRGIMHRDLKPHNVLIASDGSGLRLIDWGLAEYYHQHRDYNVRVASRYFKAPELLLGHQRYDYSVDLWSLGCVLAGILFAVHPFFHGRDNADQLTKICKVVGSEDVRQYCDKYGIDVSQDAQQRIGKSDSLRTAHLHCAQHSS